MSRRFSVSLPIAGATISVYFAGSLPGVLIAMRTVERLPIRLIVAGAMVVSSVGLIAASLVSVWPL